MCKTEKNWPGKCRNKLEREKLDKHFSSQSLTINVHHRAIIYTSPNDVSYVANN